MFNHKSNVAEKPDADATQHNDPELHPPVIWQNRKKPHTFAVVAPDEPAEWVMHHVGYTDDSIPSKPFVLNPGTPDKKHRSRD